MTREQQPNSAPYLPRLIAWEVTRSCPMECTHCRAAAHPHAYPGELTTDEGRRLIDALAAMAKPTIILTGGEPMLRPDLYDLAAYAHGRGLGVVLAPCGMYVNPEAVARMRRAGIRAISVSLDGATAQTHDAFRGAVGAFDAALAAAEAARRGGMEFQINTTVTRANASELPDLLNLAVRLGAGVFNPFLLVPTGRGKALADQALSPEEYERTLQWLAREEGRPDIRIRVTCAPHYSRILAERRGRRSGAAAARNAPPDRGCLGGKTFAFVSHMGKVQICGFLETVCGDLREENFDFRKIWETSDVLRKIRDPGAYKGKCGVCEYRRICGGCRARAFAVTHDYLASEPFCIYQPQQGTEESRP